MQFRQLCKSRPVWLVLIGGWIAGSIPAINAAEPTAGFTFQQADVAAQWEATHDVQLAPTEAGLQISITGSDPYLTGPLFQPPSDTATIARIRLQSETGGGAQLFYYSLGGPREEHSVRFAVPSGEMAEIYVPLPKLGPAVRFRLDPPGMAGRCLIESLELLTGLKTEWPAWQRITLPEGDDRAVLRCGTLELGFSKSRYGEFDIHVDGRPMGSSGVRPQIAVEHEGKVIWLGLDNDRIEWIGEHTVRGTVSAQLPGGGEVTLQQQFVRVLDGQIDVEATLAVTTECRLVYAPLLLVFPGDGAFGDQKEQALFPGVEYLENEPSSSDADVDAARAWRKVPAAHKITFPLMTVQADGRYLGVTWEPESRGPFHTQLFQTAALFDSPDRLYGTQSHVMGLIAPSATTGRREDGQVLPRLATVLDPRLPIELKARLIAGRGDTVIPAVQRYFAQAEHELDLAGQRTEMPGIEFAERLAPGWLNAPLRDGPRFRHAVAGDAFGGQPAADAVWMMQQLASVFDRDQNPESAQTAEQLRTAAREALAALTPDQLHHAAIGHIRSPNGTLLLGDPAEGMKLARDIAAGQLAQLGPEGKLEYVRDPSRPDFARTHWSKEANGLAAPVVVRALQEAAFSGDQALIDQAIAQLRKLDRYANTVPRGAQTWEIPLHTPDILASAHLVKAYSIGYELTRDPTFLEQAKYWAWTGVPFVYLQPSFSLDDDQIGRFATIPVLGATHWDSVLWIGLPVQWCGLVYADALQHLERYDESGPWDVIADGIVNSGIEQTYPESDPHAGLLPDSFNILSQTRNPADINPGTLQVPAMRAQVGFESYDFRKLVESGWTIHAPTSIWVTESSPQQAFFLLNSWSTEPYSIVVHGLKHPPHCRVFSRRKDRTEDRPSGDLIEERYFPETGTLILKLQGQQVGVGIQTEEPVAK